MKQETLIITLFSLGVKEVVINSNLYSPEELIRIASEAAKHNTVLRITNLNNKSYTIIIELAQICSEKIIIDYRE